MSVISSSTTSTTAYKVTADTTGTLVFQTGSTPTTAMTVGTDQSVTFAQAANLPNTFGFKNRIINGGMVIDQRNAGASVSMGTSTWSVDRWRAFASQTSKMTAQQNAGSATPPAGFTKYLGFTSSSAYSSSSTDRFFVFQPIEGYNIADLGWGSASASAVTLSFWARSSLTGTHSGAINNNASNRCYAFTYTINSANTWEYKTVTIPGDQSGTWLTDNGQGIEVDFNLGTGSSYLISAGSWQATYANGATGSVSIVGTNGATFYITGVQLEKGSTATSFDYRPYGTELALCQRYYWLVPIVNYINQTTSIYNGVNVYFPVTMRTTPTVTVYSTATGTSGKIRYDDGASDVNAGLNTQSASCTVFANGVSTNFGSYMKFKFEATAEL